MKLKNAVKILRRFRDWHSGKDGRTFDDTGLIRKEVGHAMDVILKHHGMPDPLTDCEACPDSRNHSMKSKKPEPAIPAFL